MSPDPHRIVRVLGAQAQANGSRLLEVYDPAAAVVRKISVSEYESFDLAMTLLSVHHARLVREMLYRDRVPVEE